MKIFPCCSRKHLEKITTLREFYLARHVERVGQAKTALKQRKHRVARSFAYSARYWLHEYLAELD